MLIVKVVNRNILNTNIHIIIMWVIQPYFCLQKIHSRWSLKSFHLLTLFCSDSLRLWEGGFVKVADGKSCRDGATGKKTTNTVEGCAKTCSGTSTVFVYGKTDCYCIIGASSKGECSLPYKDSKLDMYRYNGKLWYTACAFLKILSILWLPLQGPSKNYVTLISVIFNPPPPPYVTKRNISIPPCVT